MSEAVLERFTVVGLGASAGGLQALQQFLAAIPASTGMAFVIVVHLSPTHESHLATLLQPYTAMPVSQVEESLKILTNHVYVIPPNRNLSTIDSHLRLSPLEERRMRAPIDHFFRTLAETHAEQAIGIILSGTGSDGSVGLTRIKEQGGLTIVQEPSEASYDGMPQSAIATGLIDLILPIDAMPVQLLAYTTTTPQIPLVAEGEAPPPDEQAILQKIFVQLRIHTGQDFTRYKPATILRRLRRRLQIQQCIDLPAYLNFLRAHPGEAQALAQDFLISVTNFFRDPAVFAHLNLNVLPAIFQGKGVNDTVRIWVAGCATGDEAYSLAILLQEYANQLNHPPQIQIFATDLNLPVVQQARAGLYPTAIEVDVSTERLERYFRLDQGGYRVNQTLRELITFAPHDLLKDLPFSKIDLISCRNLFIYLQREAQQQILTMFHYALQPAGYLLLGPVEMIEDQTLFHTLSKPYSLFQVQKATNLPLRLPMPTLRLPSVTLPAEGALPIEPIVRSYGALHHRLVERYAPPSLLVNADYQIVHLSEHVGRYLQEPGGEPTHHIFKRIRPELRMALTPALQLAITEQQSTHSSPIALVDELNRVSLSVYPAQDPELQGHVLIIFTEMAPAAATVDVTPLGADAQNLIRGLEEEAAHSQERLSTTIEEYETAQEEMRAANEELLSMNEELKSTAEELETSKEELQSINEELLTVNQENKHQVEVLTQLTDDLQNLMIATDLATLFLDRDLRIQRFTPQASELFNILLADRGRPLAHLTHKLGDAPLLEAATQVLKTLQPVTREVRSMAGCWYLMRVLPYRTLADHIAGVVLTFVDITTLKAAQQALQTSEQQFQQALTAAPVPILMVATDGEMLAISDTALQLTGYPRAYLAHFSDWLRLVFSVPPPVLAQLVDQTFLQEQALAEIEVAVQMRNGEQRTWVLSSAAPQRLADGRQYTVIIANDITARKAAVAALRNLNASLEDQVAMRTVELARSNRELDQFAYLAAHDLKEPLRAIKYLSEWIAEDKETQLSAAAQLHLSKLRDRIKRMTMLLRDLLVYAKAGRQQNLPERVDTHALVKTVSEGLDFPPGFTLTIVDQLPVLLTQQVPLETVLRNLLGNAIKHHHQPGQGQIQVAAQEQGDFIEFIIRDNGPGIDPTFHTRIFEMFQKFKPSDTVEGSGVGLAVVKKTVESLGGTITVESSVGHGATFRFTWPKVSPFAPIQPELETK